LILVCKIIQFLMIMTHIIARTGIFDRTLSWNGLFFFNLKNIKIMNFFFNNIIKSNQAV
jgi:hypothetical protein